MVVDKPAGIPTYGGDESLRHGLTVRLGDWLEARGRSPRLGVHQRLDQETSGTLLFTTDPAQDEPVRRALEEHTLSRTYRAIVHDPRGALTDQTVELSLEDDGKHSRVVQSGGKRAVTEVRVLERVGTRADVELSLRSGRLHQIRVTLAHLGAPVLGDSIYGGPRAERLFLHAWRLAGTPLPRELEAPLPLTFARALHGSATGPTSESELRQLMRDALARRAPLLAHTNAFRWLHGDAESLPGVEVDVVGSFARIGWRGEARPSDAVLDVIASELEACGVLGWGAAPQTESGAPGAAGPADGLVWRGAEPRGPLVLEEGSAHYQLPSVGEAFAWFSPMLRPLRERVRGWIREGDSVLALGAEASRAAVAARVRDVAVVDRSKAALARVRSGLELVDARVRLLCEEPLAFAEREVRRNHRYGLVLLDLTAARGERDRQGLLRSALATTEAAGKLVVVRRPSTLGSRMLRRQAHEAATGLGRTIRYAKEVPLPFDVPAIMSEDAADGDSTGQARRPLVIELD